MEKHLLPLLLSSLVIKLLITDIPIGAALALLSLSGLYGFFLYLQSKKIPEANKDLKDKLASLEKQIQNSETKISAMTLSNLRR